MEINIYFDEDHTLIEQLREYLEQNKYYISLKIYDSLYILYEKKVEEVNHKLITFNYINTIQSNKKQLVFKTDNIVLRNEEDIYKVIEKQLKMLIELEEYELCSKYRDLQNKFEYYFKNSGLLNEN